MSLAQLPLIGMPQQEDHPILLIQARKAVWASNMGPEMISSAEL